MELQRLFDRFDSDSKGWLSETDMVKMICKAQWRHYTRDVLENPREFILWTSRLFADHDRRISLEEFINYTTKHESRYNRLIRALY